MLRGAWQAPARQTPRLGLWFAHRASQFSGYRVSVRCTPRSVKCFSIVLWFSLTSKSHLQLKSGLHPSLSEEPTTLVNTDQALL